ncbi:MAG: hypothetical protein A3G10_00895 [Candidatus Wildermuthbacteria bacterium RIFCSPLOWO2_12_FULL_49_9]|nr:MAG: hypothetical protein A3G10_00895 [Candidatus Wildermuthbacteria bacterium RIFCSPLOWO2_12_FULL_49_9]
MSSYSYYKETKIKVRISPLDSAQGERQMALAFAAPALAKKRHAALGQWARGALVLGLAGLVVLGSSGSAILASAFEAHVVNVTAQIEPRPEEETTTLTVTKIVCNDESLLPNWGNVKGEPPITSSTAADFLANLSEDQADDCWLEEGWFFQWAPEEVFNQFPPPPPSNTGEAGAPWVAFGPTNISGVASIVVPLDNINPRIWVREVFKEGYFPFSVEDSSVDEDLLAFDDVSAEFYCHRDVIYYDNLDFVSYPAAGETYYCVAFNVGERQEQLSSTPQQTVVLNEILPNPEGDDNQDGLLGEWVELYNLGDSAVNVASWYLEDDSSSGNRQTISDSNTHTGSTVIGAMGSGSEWLVVFMAGVVLNNTGDTVSLYNTADELQDEHIYGTSANDQDSDTDTTPGEENEPADDDDAGNEGKSVARIPDGAGDWFDPVPTPGGPNKLEDFGEEDSSGTSDGSGGGSPPPPDEEGHSSLAEVDEEGELEGGEMNEAAEEPAEEEGEGEESEEEGKLEEDESEEPTDGLSGEPVEDSSEEVIVEVNQEEQDVQSEDSDSEAAEEDGTPEESASEEPGD